MDIITNNEEKFDAVIKIASLDNYRRKPKNSTSISNISKSFLKSTIEVPINEMSKIEKQIYDIVASNQGIKAISIANKLHKTRKEINHYLYGSLRKYLSIDEQYKWKIRS